MQRFPPVEIELEFGDHDRVFKLGKKGLAELQEACGLKVTHAEGWVSVRPKPFGSIFSEHAYGGYDVEDSLKALEIGLKYGSKMTGREAKAEVEKVTEDWPATAIFTHAFAVLNAAGHGYQPPGEPEAAAETQTQTTSPSSSTSPPQSEA